MKKPILCKSCVNFDQAVCVKKCRPYVIEECLYPGNNHKVGHATACEEYVGKFYPDDAPGDDVHDCKGFIKWTGKQS